MLFNPNVLAIDAGGTMTDTIIIDEEGHFTIGKARSTPYDESIGFITSMGNALGYWDMKQANLPVANIQCFAYHLAELYRSGGHHGKQTPR